MTPFTRNLHRLAVGVHFVGLVLYALAYSIEPSWVWPLFAGWSVFYAARSWRALRRKA